MNIVNPLGQPVTSVPQDENAEVSSPVTKHEPRWFRRQREAADKRFAQIYQEFLEAVTGAATPAVPVERDLIRKAYGHMWAQFAHIMRKGSEPIELDVQAMYTKIDQVYADADAKAKQNYLTVTPISKLTPKEMVDADFVHIGDNEHGAVWLSSLAMITVDPKGQTAVFIRPRNISMDHWCAMIDLKVFNLEPDYSIVDYTMGEFGAVMQGMRAGAWAAPTKAQLDAITR